MEHVENCEAHEDLSPGSSTEHTVVPVHFVNAVKCDVKPGPGTADSCFRVPSTKLYS